MDVSGSMTSSITGSRGSQTSVITCMQVASLIAASLARVNDDCTVVSFGTNARVVPKYNPWDSVLTNAGKLYSESSSVGHGTNAGAAMDVFNRQRGKYDFIVFVSDCQSWVDSGHGYGYYGGTPLMERWATQKVGNKKAKLASRGSPE